MFIRPGRVFVIFGPSTHSHRSFSASTEPGGILDPKQVKLSRVAKAMIDPLGLVAST